MSAASSSSTRRHLRTVGAALAAAGGRWVQLATAVVVGVWLVGLLDVLTTLKRGGGPALPAPAHVALVAGGLTLAVVVGAGVEALRTLGWGLQRLTVRLGRRWHLRGIAPTVWPAALVGAWAASRLFDAHATFVKHDGAAWLVTGYAVLLGLGLGVLLDRLRRGLAGGSGVLRGAARATIALGGGLFVVALHHVNSHYFTGLYLPLHRALTGAEVVAASVTAGLALSGLRLRNHLIPLGLLAVSAGIAAPLVRLADARPAVYFFGTELRHVAETWAPLLDADGDGVPGRLGGTDCDDNNPDVHPLAFERPGNGIDDNCRLGDRTEAPRPPVRMANPVPELETWRAAHPKVNVVLLFVDTWRTDHFDADFTPNLWKLAEKSVRFTQARTTAPRTPMAWMSLLRGRFLGRSLTCRQRLASPGSNTLIDRLHQFGLSTYGRLIGQSWKRYHAASGYTRLIQSGRVAGVNSPAVTRDALAMLRAATGPFFLVAHYTDPHAPHVVHASAPVEDDSLRARYASEVRFTDQQLGRLLAELENTGRMADTVVVVFADHGENLGEHGDVGGHHGVSLFDEVVHIPLMFYVPGVAAARVDDPVSIVDVAPTILDLVGARPLGGADGRSLAGHFFGAPPPLAPTLSEFYDFGHRLRAVVFADHKLVVDAHHGVRLLFDLKADPGELTDVLATRPEVAAVLQRWLDQWIEHAADPSEVNPDRCKNLVPVPAETDDD